MSGNPITFFHKTPPLRLTASQTQFSNAVATFGCHSIFFAALWLASQHGVDMVYIVALLVACLLSLPAHAALWSYEGYKNGQGDWPMLSPDFAKCESGSEQSPVSISHTNSKALPPLSFHYSGGLARFSLDRYTVIATPMSGQSLGEGNETATLREMTLHSPSEHEVSGTFYPLELVLMHERGGKPVRLSVFVKEGAPNAALQTLADHFPAQSGQPSTTLFDWPALLPAQRGYYSYRGSLSYPPCTEGVEVRVLKQPIEASGEQIRAIVSHLGRNSRAVQPILMRNITESTDE